MTKELKVDETMISHNSSTSEEVEHVTTTKDNTGISFIRNTATGSEWYNRKENKVHFVNELHFPQSAERDTPQAVGPLSADLDFEQGTERQQEPDSIFAAMTVKEMKQYAEANEIAYPTDLKKKSDIAEFMEYENLNR